MRAWVVVVVVLFATLARSLRRRLLGGERHTSERAQSADIVFTGGAIYTLIPR